MLLPYLKQAIRAVPAVAPLLTGRARWLALEGTPYKTYEFFLSTLERLVTSVYENNLGGEFIDIMANLLQGQITQAFEAAWADDGNEDVMPDYMKTAADNFILEQYDYVDQYFRDIVDARIDGTGIEPLLARAELWANRYNDAYTDAVALIALQNGGKLVWREGDTEKKCPVCLALDGIVAYASLWEELDVTTQNAPNWALSQHAEGCGGWRCLCMLEPTDERQTRGAREAILAAIGG